MTAPPPRPNHHSTLATALSFVLPFGLYLSTAARTVQGGDTGEFGVLGLVGGVAHPPGYPLFTLLAKAFGALPFGVPFFRVALVSALCGAAAVAVMQRVTWRLTGSVLASTGAALLFAVSEEQWRLAGVPEVFALNALLAALILFLAVRLKESPPEQWGRRAFWLGLACGLGGANHHSIVFCAPLVLWPLLSIPRRDLLRPALLLLLGTVLGLTPYLLLPYWARSAPPGAVVWGHFDSAGGLLAHVLRREYGTFRLSGAGDSNVFHGAPLAAFLTTFPTHSLLLAAVLSLIGLVAARRQRWVWPVLLAFLLAGPLFTSLFNMPLNPYSRQIQARFYLLPELLLVPLMAAGLAALARRQRQVIALLIGLAVLASVALHRPRVNWSADSFIERYHLALLRGTAPDAVVYGTGDTTLWAVRWLQQVLGERRDVTYVHASLRTDWYDRRLQQEAPEFAGSGRRVENLKETYRAAAAKRPLYLVRSLSDLPLHGFAQTAPEGLLDRVLTPEVAVITADEQKERLLDTMTLLGDQPPDPADQENAALRMVLALRWFELANRLEQAGNAPGAQACREVGQELIPRDGLGEQYRKSVGLR